MRVLFEHKTCIWTQKFCSDTNVQTQMFRHKKRGICTAVHLCTLMQKPLLSGDGGIRTHDLYTASVALSQLSYAPMRFFKSLNYHTRKLSELQHLFLLFFSRFYVPDFMRRFSALIFSADFHTFSRQLP